MSSETRESMMQRLGRLVSGRKLDAGATGAAGAGAGARSSGGKRGSAAPALARVTREEEAPLAGFRWLRVKRTFYEDESGEAREWETVERTTRRDGAPDAVFVIATFANAPKGSRAAAEPEVLLVSQFRPCLGRYVLELPAGLVDAGETPAQAAVRELKEETGFSGTVLSATPLLPSDAGMTNATLAFVQVRVDLSAPENRGTPKAEQQDGEFIERHRVPVSQLLQVLNDPARISAEKRLLVDARLYSVALGMQGGLFAAK